MGISNLTSSIRGVTGNEKITNLKTIQAQNVIAVEATIGGVAVSSNLILQSLIANTASIDTLAVDHLKANTATVIVTGTILNLEVNYIEANTASFGSGGVTFAGPLDLLFTPANEVTVNTFKLDINPTGILTGGFTDHVGLYIDLDSDVDANGKAYYTEGISVDIDYTGVDTILGMDGALLTVTNGGAGTISNAYGAERWIDQDGAGEITTGYGDYTWLNRGAGTFTTAYGSYIDVDGVIGAAYGFYADLTDHTGDGWGIYCDGEDNNYLSGDLAVDGDIAVGTGQGYINVNASVGVNGYGFRDLNGSVQFKHSGGTWGDLT